MSKALAYVAALGLFYAIPFGVKALGFNHPAAKLGACAVVGVALYKAGFNDWVVEDLAKALAPTDEDA